jgi:hypothetical protein
MSKLLIAVTLAAGSVVLGSAHASPAVPGAVTPGLDRLGGAEAVHCTPGKRHHVPTWNYRSDGCRRPSRTKAPIQKGPAAKTKSTSLQQ